MKAPTEPRLEQEPSASSYRDLSLLEELLFCMVLALTCTATIAVVAGTAGYLWHRYGDAALHLATQLLSVMPG